MIEPATFVLRITGTNYYVSSVGKDLVGLTGSALTAPFIVASKVEHYLETISARGWVPRDRMEAVPNPTCACCGATTSHDGKGYRQDNILHPRGDGWRCEKHLDRIPCVIAGCKRTAAAGKGHSAIMCGIHWRQAPKAMRDRHAEIRRIARRKGWTKALSDMDWRLWDEIVETVSEGGRLDEAEINKMFGWE